MSSSTLEFEVQDTFALLQLDDLFIEPLHAADFKSCEATTCRILLVVSPVKMVRPGLRVRTRHGRALGLLINASICLEAKQTYVGLEFSFVI